MIVFSLTVAMMSSCQAVANLESKTQHVVITHANTSNGIKIPTFFF